MSEHQKDTEFLRHIIVYVDTQEHRDLEKKIVQAQRDERCVRRLIALAVFFSALAVVGLAYVALLAENFSYGQSQLAVTIFCELGLASLICLAGFAVLAAVYRERLNRLREECRRLVKGLVASRLGKSQVATVQSDSPEPGDCAIAHNPAPVIASQPPARLRT